MVTVEEYKEKLAEHLSKEANIFGLSREFVHSWEVTGGPKTMKQCKRKGVLGTLSSSPMVDGLGVVVHGLGITVINEYKIIFLMLFVRTYYSIRDLRIGRILITTRNSTFF